MNPSVETCLVKLLGEVRQRLWLASMIRGATTGLLLGVAAAFVFSILRLALFPQAHWGWAVVITLASGVSGWIVGALKLSTDQTAARLIDRHYQLKDRSITTLEFLQAGSLPTRRTSSADTAARKLQIEEANRHLDRVAPADCVPLSPWNRSLQWAAGIAVIVTLVLAVSRGGVERVEAQPVLALATEQAQTLRESVLPELKELADEQQDPEVEKLLAELEEKVDEMESETLTPMDQMAKLSEMEQALAEVRDAMQLQQTDAALQSLAAAIKPSDELQQAAKALEGKEYEEASESLESVNPSNIGDKQRRAVSDNLKKMVSSLKPGRNGKLSEAIMQFAEGLDSKNMKECKNSLSKLAGECKKQGQCKKIGQCMAKQLNRLAQCKSQCRSQCAGQSDSMIAKKSNSPSQKAGRAASGNPLGDKATRIDASRKEEQLTGVQGEGPSETEILQAPEGEQNAARAYAKRYAEFRRQAEAVLDSEPLPMGHRETVRTYFEAIRPSTEAAKQVAE
jgi:hypothetical protein